MFKLVSHIATTTHIDADQYFPLLRYQLCHDGQAGTDDLDPSFLKLEANTWELVMHLYKSVLSAQLLRNGAQLQAFYSFAYVELPLWSSCATNRDKLCLQGLPKEGQDVLSLSGHHHEVFLRRPRFGANE